MRKLAIGIIIIFIVAIGVGIQVYKFYKLKNEISVQEISSYSISTKGIGPIPTKIGVNFTVNVKNSSSCSLDIERLTYTITIEGRNFGQDSLYGITLPAHSTTPIPISLEFTSADAMRTLWDYLVRGGFEFKVSGNIDIPFKMFGILKVTTISTTYSESKYLQKKGLVGGKVKGATDISLQSPPRYVRKGEVVVFRGRLTEEDTGAGLPNQKVEIADDDGIGDDVMATGYTNEKGYFRISWTAKSTDWDDISDVYARFLGSPNFGESDSGKRYMVEVITEHSTRGIESYSLI